MDTHRRDLSRSMLQGSFSGLPQAVAAQVATILMTCGTVFQLSPPAAVGLSWTESVLHTFNGANGDGLIPASGVINGGAGRLYGTTLHGGNRKTACGGGPFGCGIIFQLSPPSLAGGIWTETILHEFGNGGSPNGLSEVGKGKFLGTTAGISGTAFRFTL